MSFLVMAKRLLLLSALIASITANIDGVSASCSYSEMFSCSSDITSLANEARHLETVCSDLATVCQASLDCSASTDSSTKTMWLDYVGFKNGGVYLCTNSEANGVMNNGGQDCWRYVDSYMAACRKSETCSGYKEALCCFYGDMAKGCNSVDGAARIWTKFQVIRLKPITDPMGCNIDTSGFTSTTCRGSSSGGGTGSGGTGNSGSGSSTHPLGVSQSRSVSTLKPLLVVLFTIMCTSLGVNRTL